MKRVLMITIPFMLLIMAGFFFLGKEVIFHTTSYHIPEKYKIEVSGLSDLYFDLYDSAGYKVRTYDKIPKQQKDKILKERTLLISFNRVHPLWTLLYILSGILFIVYFIQWCVSVDCCKPHDPSSGKHTNWDSQCYGLCDKRCDLYNKISEYDLNPQKDKIKHFWGY